MTLRDAKAQVKEYNEQLYRLYSSPVHCKEDLICLRERVEALRERIHLAEAGMYTWAGIDR